MSPSTSDQDIAGGDATASQSVGLNTPHPSEGESVAIRPEDTSEIYAEPDRTLADAAAALDINGVTESNQRTAEEEDHSTAYFNFCALGDLESVHRFEHLVECADDQGNTGALYAARCGGEEGLQTLRWLIKNIDPFEKANVHGRTPLMEAAQRGNLEVVQRLDAYVSLAHRSVRDKKQLRALDIAEAALSNSQSEDYGTRERRSRI